MIFATTPAPTVLPPSRMAKRRPSSIAIGLISSTFILMLSPGMTISAPSGNSHRSRHIRRAEVELRPIALEERRVTAALFLRQHVHLASNFVCGVMEPGFASTWPRSTSSRFVPRSSTPTLSPA